MYKSILFDSFYIISTYSSGPPRMGWTAINGKQKENEKFVMWDSQAKLPSLHASWVKFERDV